MKKFFAVLLTLCLLLPLCALGEEGSPVPQDNVVVTSHTAVIDGKEIPYTATVGTMAMSTSLGQYEIFYSAMTVEAEDPAQRPITFIFNGGPGSSSCWLQLGLYGPVGIDMAEDGLIDRLGIGTVNNEYSLLDVTDLVFIDPVGTGYSRACEGTDPTTFYNYENDIVSIGDFIYQYIGRNNRWLSPKYISGESYGTRRAVGLCEYLMDQVRLDMNGLILISCYHDFLSFGIFGGNDLPYISFFPSMAATAWYHKKADPVYQAMSIEDYMKEARTFASGDYLTALFQGSSLPAEESEKIAERMSAFLGVPKEYIMDANLRVEYSSFCDELLKDQNLRIGRTDTRVTGPKTGGDLGSGAGDPSGMGLFEAFNAAFCEYCANFLGYKTDSYYNALSLDVNMAWGDQSQCQEESIYNIMTKNPYLKVWVVSGYYDFATPFFGTEWAYNHSFLPESALKNLKFSYHEAGHLFYLYKPSKIRFREEALAWYAAK